MYNFDLANESQLFAHLVKTLVLKRCENNFYTTSQIANLVFGKGNSANMALVTRVTLTYHNYFERYGIYKKRLLLEKVRRDHPQIFRKASEPQVIINPEGKETPLINNLIKALKEEIIAIKQISRPIKIDGLQNIKKIGVKYIYSANVNLQSDEEVILNEGALIKLLPAGAGGAVLSFDPIHNLLYFECDFKLNTSMYYSMLVDLTTIIGPLIDVLEAYNRDGLNGLAKVVTNKETYPNRVGDLRGVFYSNLDPSQKGAANNALNSDVSFIWGPPGTGKSHCLSVILNELLNKNEKTLVVSIANVAVDQLLTKTLNLLDEQAPFKSTKLINDGEILRIGYITEDPLVKRFDDVPTQKEILLLYKKIKEIQQKIHNAHSHSTKAELTAEKRALSRQVNEIQKARIDRGRLVFSTATKAVMDSTVSATYFDNLVIDEASMMSIPYLFALLKRVSKRVIIAGDFTQLSPICISQTDLADRYLRKDLFTLAGIDKNNMYHPSLSQLNINRRATEEICNLYNQAFYRNSMVVERKHPRINNAGVFYIPLDPTGAEFTESKSRRNKASFKIVTDFILSRINRTEASIGIIAPYRAQVNDYRKFFKEQKIARDKLNKIKIGTIHTFQGSEADIIVLDTVDTSDIGVGRLFHYEQGERLINVALSRAKDALIVFGDLEAFYKSNKVSAKVFKVLNAIKSKKTVIGQI
jgi:hypothetical protein